MLFTPCGNKWCSTGWSRHVVPNRQTPFGRNKPGEEVPLPLRRRFTFVDRGQLLCLRAADLRSRLRSRAQAGPETGVLDHSRKTYRKARERRDEGGLGTDDERLASLGGGIQELLLLQAA